ncbi:aspartate/glutamate racemase family protein [Microbacter sp. GSS18]|nr:aspartate/glutamate racemase family protein [Microbacter sp. GSS18]
MKILVVNCNTSTDTSRAIGAIARATASAGTEIVMVQPGWGVSSAEGYYESYVSAAAVLDALSEHGPVADAIVLAGFGEHGREGARQLLTAPVVDITEAAAIAAQLVGHRYGVVTTLSTTVAGIWDSLTLSGMSARCVGVRAAGIPVLDIHDDVHETAAALATEAEILVATGADAIVLGCAGMAGLDVALEQRVGVPVIDGVQAAIGLSETLVRMGKSTSKVGPYAPPNAHKPRPGWPLRQSAIVALDIDALTTTNTPGSS